LPVVDAVAARAPCPSTRLAGTEAAAVITCSARGRYGPLTVAARARAAAAAWRALACAGGWVGLVGACVGASRSSMPRPPPPAPGGVKGRESDRPQGGLQALDAYPARRRASSTPTNGRHPPHPTPSRRRRGRASDPAGDSVGDRASDGVWGRVRARDGDRGGGRDWAGLRARAPIVRDGDRVRVGARDRGCKPQARRSAAARRAYSTSPTVAATPMAMTPAKNSPGAGGSPAAMGSAMKRW